MTHKVNAAVFRIGKSLNWHSLGSPLYRWRDLKINLFLNYFLARFLERESYRLVRYGVRSESNIFKIAIVAFRLMSTQIGFPRGVGKSFFETYWKDHNVYKYHFKLGTFSYVLQGLEDAVNSPYDDAAGFIHIDHSKKHFSVGPRWNWAKTFVFFNEGVGIADPDPEYPLFPIAGIGFSASFYIRIVAKLMVLRYAVRKSIMRVARRKLLTTRPGLLPPTKRWVFNPFNTDNMFITGSSSAKMKCKNFIFSFLLLRIKNKGLLKQHFKALNTGVKQVPVTRAWWLRARVLQLKKKKVLQLKKKKVLKLKKKKVLKLKKKKSFLKLAKEKRILRIKKFRSVRRHRRKKAYYHEGRYNLNFFFKRLAAKNKGFKYLGVNKIVRAAKNKLTRRFFKHRGITEFKKEVINQTRNKVLFSNFLKAAINLTSFFNCLYSSKNRLRFIAIFKKICYFKFKQSVRTMRPLRSLSKPLYRFFSSRYSKRNFFFKSFKHKRSRIWRDLTRLSGIKKILGFKIFKKIKKLKIKKLKKNYLRNNRISFFLYFFFSNMAIFKFYRLRFKPDSVKYLYRKKKLIFFLEKRLSVFLKRGVMLKFFNPLEFNSMDDLWVKSLLDSLNFISNMYLRDRFDYKPAFILSLHAMLAYKYNSPAFLGSYVANQLEWRWRKRSHASFIRLLIYFFKGLKFNTMYTKDLVSFSIGFYGKVWGKLRAGKFIIRSAEGNALPLRRVSLRMDSSFTWAQSQFGTFGIRIWIARN